MRVRLCTRCAAVAELWVCLRAQQAAPAACPGSLAGGRALADAINAPHPPAAHTTTSTLHRSVRALACATLHWPRVPLSWTIATASSARARRSSTAARLSWRRQRQRWPSARPRRQQLRRLWTRVRARRRSSRRSRRHCSSSWMRACRKWRQARRLSARERRRCRWVAWLGVACTAQREQQQVMPLHAATAPADGCSNADRPS